MEECSLSCKNGEDFSAWLCDVVTTYKPLSDSDKNTLLLTLITNSEVCTAWNQRIDSLGDVWRAKAWERGVNVDAISVPDTNIPHCLSSSSTYCNNRARLYKAVYRHAERFLSGLEKGDRSLKIIKDFVDTGGQEVTHFQCQDGHIFTGHLKCIRMWSLFDGGLEKEITIAWPQTRMLLYNDDHLYMSSYPVTLKILKVSGGASNNRQHEYQGHYNAILTLDVSPDKYFALTGSSDKTVRVWDLQNKELFMTLDHAHTAAVTKVSFLPCGENSELRFISCGSSGFFSWSLDVPTRKVDYGIGVCENNQTEIVSYYHDFSKPDTLYTIVWNDYLRTSSLRSYHLYADMVIRFDNYWHPLVKGVKAHLLGIGQRFALYYCSISCQDFYLFDLVSRCHLVTIATPNFAFEVARNGYSCDLCSTSWLDGFVFEDMHGLKTVFTAKGGRNSLMVGVWNVPPLDGVDNEQEKSFQGRLLQWSRTNGKKMK